ncbi:MAG: 1-acyl-sn-glycerol-3-phosphate acyltransferase [Salinivirgaceae bacterium]|nr:1-acyl-sn-glycerol-3-phosphate acyltransferase [Salinivirgaceae bacterium]
MKKIIAIPFTLIHGIIMLLLLGIFHILQLISFNFFGYTAHKKTVDLLNTLMVLNHYTQLCHPTFHGLSNIPKNKPLLIISNHQSMYDISPIIIAFKKNHVKFVAKKELGKYLPSISYNLQKGGSAIIDRSNGSQSIREILKLGKNMESRNWSACIFPEGTRSTDGNLKKFQAAGIKTLLKASPNALIVPFVIDGNHKLHKWGKFPLNIGLRLKYTALAPIHRNDFLSDEALIAEVHKRISEALVK